MKIRVADVNIQEKVQKKKDITKKKVGKAEKKRIWTAALLKSKTMFDNPEEELLFQETASVIGYLFLFKRNHFYSAAAVVKTNQNLA